MKRKLFIVLLFCCSFSLSCGYTTSSTLPANQKTICVESFENKIVYTSKSSQNLYFPLLEVNVTDAVIDRFLFDGNLKIAGMGTSDLLLKGELKSYSKGGLRYTDDDDVQEYRVRVTVSLELWDADKEELIWSESGFSGEATYFVTGEKATSEEAAVELAIVDLARRIVERTIENW